MLLTSTLYAGIQWGHLTGLNKVRPLKQVLETSQDATLGLTNTIKIWQSELTTCLAIWYFGLEEDKTDNQVSMDKVIKLSKLVFFQRKSA